MTSEAEPCINWDKRGISYPTHKNEYARASENSDLLFSISALPGKLKKKIVKNKSFDNTTGGSLKKSMPTVFVEMIRRSLRQELILPL